MSSHSRGTISPESCIGIVPRKSRAQGKPDAPHAPAASCAKIKSTRVSHHRSTGIPGLPCATVYDLLRALSGDRALCHRRLRNVSQTSRQRRGVKTTRLRRPRQCTRLVRCPRPSHPAPDVRDDREAPLFVGAGRGELLEMICPTAKAKYFSQGGWTSGQISRGKSR
jgi:hypothetical protein